MTISRSNINKQLTPELKTVKKFKKLIKKLKKKRKN